MKKLGLVPYLNTLPLVYFLKGYEFIRAVPSELCSLFHEGHLEAALLPIYELFTKPTGLIVNDISISTHTEAGSVLLFLNRPIDSVKLLALDQSSLSSKHLLKLIIKEYYVLDCEYEEHTPKYILQNADRYDAYLLIGDEAIYHRTVNPSFIDLGKIWHDWTDYPFVFAVWVLREANSSLKHDLLESKQTGLAQLSEIIDVTSFKDKDFLKKYFEFYLHFDLGDREKKGLELYQTKLYESKLIQDKLELKYY